MKNKTGFLFLLLTFNLIIYSQTVEPNDAENKYIVKCYLLTCDAENTIKSIDTAQATPANVAALKISVFNFMDQWNGVLKSVRAELPASENILLLASIETLCDTGAALVNAYCGLLQRYNAAGGINDIKGLFQLAYDAYTNPIDFIKKYLMEKIKK